MNKKTIKQLEEVLKNGTPSDLYSLVPKSKRKAFEWFAHWFGFTKEDIAKRALWLKPSPYCGLYRTGCNAE